MALKNCTAVNRLRVLACRSRTGLSARRFTQPAQQRPSLAMRSGIKQTQAGRAYQPTRLLTMCAATGPQYSAELETILAPNICSPEAFTALLQETGPGGRLLLCRLRGVTEGPGSVSRYCRMALELVRALDGCPLPVWSGGWEAVEVVYGSDDEQVWDQPLIPVLWSPDRGIIRALPAAPIQPISPDFDHDDMQSFMSSLLFCQFSSGLEIILRDGIDSGRGMLASYDRSLYNLDTVVVPDEGIPVRLDLDMSDTHYRVLHLTAPVTARQLLQAMSDFFSQPLGEDGLIEALVFMGNEWIEDARDPMLWGTSKRGLNVEWLRQLTWNDTTGEQWVAHDLCRRGPGHYYQVFKGE